jgi:hypothetical protein
MAVPNAPPKDREELTYDRFLPRLLERLAPEAALIVTGVSPAIIRALKKTVGRTNKGGSCKEKTPIKKAFAINITERIGFLCQRSHNIPQSGLPKRRPSQIRVVANPMKIGWPSISFRYS